jgi:hypothetical protein
MGVLRGGEGTKRRTSRESTLDRRETAAPHAAVRHFSTGNRAALRHPKARTRAPAIEERRWRGDVRRIKIGCGVRARRPAQTGRMRFGVRLRTYTSTPEPPEGRLLVSNLYEMAIARF